MAQTEHLKMLTTHRLLHLATGHADLFLSEKMTFVAQIILTGRALRSVGNFTSL